MRARIAPTVAMIGVFLLGSTLRFDRLGASDISDDESFSWRIIQYPVPEILSRLSGDANPPLYYLALRGWAAGAGDSRSALRALSAVFGSLTLLAVFGFVRQLALDLGPPGLASRAAWAGVLAAALAAVHTSQVQFSQLARAYTLGTSLAASSSWLLLRALRSDRGGGFGRWTLYGLSAAAFAYTHYYAAFTLLVHSAVVAATAFVRGGDRGWRLVREAAFGGSVFLALYAPWLPSLWVQARSVQAGFWIAPLNSSGTRELFSTFFSGLPLGDASLEWAVLAAGLAILAFLPWIGRRAGLLLLLMVVCPCAAGVGLSLVSGRPILIGRYLIFSQLFYLCALAILAVAATAPPVRAVLTVLFLSNFAAAAALELTDRGIPPRGLEMLTEAIAANYHEGESIVVGDPALANRTFYHLSRLGLSIRLQVVGEPPAGSGHVVHAASIPDEDWIRPAEIAHLRSPVLWAVGDPKSLTRPLPPPWYATSSQLFASPESLTYLTRWARDADP